MSEGRLAVAPLAASTLNFRSVVNDSLFNLRQLHFGIFDMTVHEPKTHADIEALPPSSGMRSDGWLVAVLPSWASCHVARYSGERVE
jgi:hypothetical protein